MQYAPTHPPLDYVSNWVWSEFLRVQAALLRPEVDHIMFKVHHVSPARLTDGMVFFADGTDFNPGGGAGLYARVGGVWIKL